MNSCGVECEVERSSRLSSGERPSQAKEQLSAGVLESESPRSNRSTKPITKSCQKPTTASTAYAEGIARKFAESAKRLDSRRSHMKQQLSRSLSKDVSEPEPAVESSNDEFYTSYLSVRSLPVTDFLRDEDPIYVLPISSISEPRFLTALGVNRVEKQQIAGLGVITQNQTAGDQSFVSSLEQLASRALVRLAIDPPPTVGHVQRRSSSWLLRPFPDGQR